VTGQCLLCQVRSQFHPDADTTGKAGAILAADVDLDAAMTKPACPHTRTQLIAKDNDAQYVECLDCGEILEAGEMEKVEKKDPAGFDGSLSDA
jgi:hypothetical protein